MKNWMRKQYSQFDIYLIIQSSILLLFVYLLSGCNNSLLDSNSVSNPPIKNKKFFLCIIEWQ